MTRRFRTKTNFFHLSQELRGLIWKRFRFLHSKEIVNSFLLERTHHKPCNYSIAGVYPCEYEAIFRFSDDKSIIISKILYPHWPYSRSYAVWTECNSVKIHLFEDGSMGEPYAKLYLKTHVVAERWLCLSENSQWIKTHENDFYVGPQYN